MEQSSNLSLPKHIYPSLHPLQNCVSYLHHTSKRSALLHSPIIHHLTARSIHIIISFSISTSSLILSEILQPLLSQFRQWAGYTAIDLWWNKLPTDLHKFAHSLKFTCLRLRPSAPLSLHEWKPNSSSYHILILLWHNLTTNSITDYHCNIVIVIVNTTSYVAPLVTSHFVLSLFGVWPGSRMNRGAWLLWTWFVTQGPKILCLSFLAFSFSHILHCICFKILFTEPKYLVSNWSYTS